MTSILGPIFMSALVYNRPCLHRKIASFFVVIQKYKTNFQRVGLFKILWLLNCQVSSSCQHMSTSQNYWLCLLLSKKYQTNYFTAVLFREVRHVGNYLFQPTYKCTANVRCLNLLFFEIELRDFNSRLTLFIEVLCFSLYFVKKSSLKLKPIS